MADLESYRNSHNKAFFEKKKSKSQLEDSGDSLDEETTGREHLQSVVQSQAREGNRKVEKMQPPPPPIPTMVEFIARRGEQNVVSAKPNKR